MSGSAPRPQSRFTPRSPEILSARLRPAWDRLMVAHRRYTSANGDALAGSLTYALLVGTAPAILLVSVILSAFGASGESIRGALREAADVLLPAEVAHALDFVEPGSAVLRVSLVVLLVWTSMRLVRATRTAVRAMCGQNAGSGNPVFDAARDAVLGVLLLSAATVLVLFVAVTATGHWWAAAVALPAVWLFCVGVMLRAPWPEPGRPTVPAALRAGAVATVLLALLTLVAGHYFAATAELHASVYPSVGAFVGVLVWSSLACRVLLRATAWASTAPRDAVPEHAEEASPEGTGDRPAEAVPSEGPR